MCYLESEHSLEYCHVEIDCGQEVYDVHSLVDELHLLGGGYEAGQQLESEPRVAETLLNKQAVTKFFAHFNRDKKVFFLNIFCSFCVILYSLCELIIFSGLKSIKNCIKQKKNNFFVFLFLFFPCTPRGLNN